MTEKFKFGEKQWKKNDITLSDTFHDDNTELKIPNFYPIK